ncbi:hypothetical protein FH972_022674 [Carpinus fangiana]|uniref:Uncharacterized protein n=1 Tax=Carpinus fangiana TaxID=176857 RepID=A0A5N6KT88_9ROSI|nr:hypothetical protein FH972_022674 [Carpinus fangiana]
MSDGGLSTLASSVGVAVKLLQTIYEVKAVTKKTESLITTTTLVLNTLDNSKRLRRQKSGLLETTQKRWMDNEVFPRSHAAIVSVSELISRARVDRAAYKDRIRVSTKLRFVLMESPSVLEKLHEMGIVYTALTGAFTQLSMLGNLCCTTSIPHRRSFSGSTNIGSSCAESNTSLRSTSITAYASSTHNVDNTSLAETAPPRYDEIELASEPSRQDSHQEPTSTVSDEFLPSITIRDARDTSTIAYLDGTWQYPSSFLNYESCDKSLPANEVEIPVESLEKEVKLSSSALTGENYATIAYLADFHTANQTTLATTSPITSPPSGRTYEPEMNWSYTLGPEGRDMQYISFGASKTTMNSFNVCEMPTSSHAQLAVSTETQNAPMQTGLVDYKCAGRIWLEREDSP